jgi:hypothetical protein
MLATNVNVTGEAGLLRWRSLAVAFRNISTLDVRGCRHLWVCYETNDKWNWILRIEKLQEATDRVLQCYNNFKKTVTQM